MFVVWLFISYLAKREAQNEAMFTVFQDRLQSIATDKGAVIRDVTLAMADIKIAVKENTLATQKLESAVQGLTGSIDNNGKHPHG